MVVHPICARLRDLRAAAGVSLATVAEVCGLTLQQISLYERGDVAPSLANLERWAAVFGLKVGLHY